MIARRFDADDRGSVLPLILGFFLLALIVVGAAVSLSQAFTQQRDLQDSCDGAAAAAAASAGDLDRGGTLAGASTLQFADVEDAVQAYAERDPARPGITFRSELSQNGHRLTVRCVQTESLAFGRLVGRPTLQHIAYSSARAAVLG